MALDIPRQRRERSFILGERKKKNCVLHVYKASGLRISIRGFLALDSFVASFNLPILPLRSPRRQVQSHYFLEPRTLVQNQ